MNALARAFFQHAFRPLIWLIYRIRRVGTENVPREGGVLLLSNHVSYIDSFILYLSCPRPVRFVVLESYTRVKGIAWFLRLFGAIPIRPEKSKEAIVLTVAALQAGDVVCLFPEGGLTRLGVLTELKKGFELIARKAGAPVVPVYMDGLFESIFSFERGRFFRKRPRSLPCPLQVAFGPPIPATEANIESLRQALTEQSCAAFAQRREFSRPLEHAAVRALKRKRSRLLFAEYGRDEPRLWTRAQTLALAVTIARRLMPRTELGQRIGLLLPSGPLPSILHLGLVLAGKTPVNLPFTLDQEDLEACARHLPKLGIRTVITSRAFMPHLMDFWQGEEGVFIDMKSLLPAAASPMGLFERIRAVLEPAWLTAWRLDLNRRDPDRELLGLVPDPQSPPLFLTGREVHRDVRRVYAANFLDREDALYTEEPLSSPEGLVLGCWGAILGRGRAVSRSLALRADKEGLARALAEQEITQLAGHLSLYDALGAEDLPATLRWGIVFGNPDPARLEEAEARLGRPLCRAWSSQGRIVSMSRPDPNPEEDRQRQYQKGRDADSVGHLLPGLAARIEGKRLFLKAAPESDYREVGAIRRLAPEGLLYL